MATKVKPAEGDAAPEAPAEFPITLGEFASKAQPAGGVKAFVALMKEEGEQQPRLSGEWQRLYSLFMSKPVGVGWKEWSKTTKGGI